MQIEQGMRSRRFLRAGQVSVSAAKTVRGLLGKRRKRHTLNGANGALRVGIKFPQRFDGISEEFDAHGPLGFRGKNIDDSAAHRELAGHFHHVMGFVADAAEMRDQVVERKSFIASERARLIRIVSRVGKTHASRSHGRDHDAGLAGGVAPQSYRAIFKNFRVRSGLLPRQNVHGRQDRHFGCFLPGERGVKELHGRGENFRSRPRFHQDHHGAAQFGGNDGRKQGFCCIRQTREPLASSPLAERIDRGLQRGLPAHRRQSFRNRGQNHDLVLVSRWSGRSIGAGTANSLH